MSAKYEFGLVGLGVMGRNFLLNVAEHGFSAVGLDKDQYKVAALQEDSSGKILAATGNSREFINALKTPRKIMLLVPAGAVVDAVIDELIELLSPGDLIIDGGNSHFRDTDRRIVYCQENKLRFMGVGVSGGAKGARFGPSIMPGGDREDYSLIAPLFESVAAKVEATPCVAYLGKGSSGNYVKMVHNGIEYGLMQILSESYSLLKDGLGYSNDALHQTYSKWNVGRLSSYLVEITSKIFERQDDLGEGHLVDQILDRAKQKGTGKWTSQDALDLGVSIPSIDSAVSMRQLSALKELRQELSGRYPKPQVQKLKLTEADIEQAVFASFIITYAQGLHQLAHASREYQYNLHLETVCKIWRGGCIIRAELLNDFMHAFEGNADLENLLLDSSIQSILKEALEGYRRVVANATQAALPVMTLASGLHYFDAIVNDKLPMNLVQAQRDFFGAHTYERIDQPGLFHTEWEK